MINNKNIHPEQIAIICHEVNKVYCSFLGDFSQKEWTQADEWQRESARKGVIYALENPNATPEDQHQAWLEEKIKNGWKYGSEKNAEKKIHPCCVPYKDLPKSQHIKDYLFQAIVTAFVKAALE